MSLWGRTGISIRPAEVADCDVLSEIHASAFRRGWSDAEFESMLVQSGVHGLLAHFRGLVGRLSAAGFILYRFAAEEAEILSVAVAPDYRRRGIGRQLIEEMLRHSYREGAHDIHLEVEDTNAAAIALYRGVEFRESGRRSGYYRQGRETPGGALVMLRQLRQADKPGSVM
jgi:ribosomal-protein-alanine N-acetyltransferase